VTVCPKSLAARDDSRFEYCRSILANMGIGGVRGVFFL
jgi:hypothetical protein